MSIKHGHTLLSHTTDEVISTGDIPGLHHVHDGPARNTATLADPYNLAPAHTFLNRIINGELSHHPGSQARPTVVLFGENHHTPAHKLLLAGILQTCIHHAQTDTDNLLYAEEKPYDTLQNIAQRLDLSVPRKHYWQLKRLDSWGHRALEGLCSIDRDGDHIVNPALRLLYQSLLDNGVSTHFNDVARTNDRKSGKDIINTNDPVFYTSQWREYAAALTDITPDRSCPEVSSSPGIALRNHIMCYRALNSGHSVIVQHCGGDHVFGEQNDITSQHALATIYQQAGCHVVPILITNDDDRDPPETSIDPRALADHPNTVILRNVKGTCERESTQEEEIRYMQQLKGAWKTEATRDPLQLLFNAVRHDHAKNRISELIAEAKRNATSDKPGFWQRMRLG
jgi:hypothetical protein